MAVRRWKRRRVFERDSYTCRYCGFDMRLHVPYPHLGMLTVDHIIPRSAGGDDRDKNLVTCCVPCNRRKRNLRLEEFVDERTLEALRQVRGLKIRSRDEAALEFWKNLPNGDRRAQG